MSAYPIGSAMPRFNCTRCIWCHDFVTTYQSDFKLMPLGSVLGMLIAALTVLSAPSHAQSVDDSLRIYAVDVVKTPPFEKEFVGYGVYLGNGYVITAAHVVGHWPYFTHPRVRIGSQTFPATVVKEGSFSTLDLALLSINTASLPIALQLRRDPLCENPPRIGMQAINVLPDRTSRAHIISPFSIAPELQRRFKTLIDSPEASGSGLFDAERKCLMGIMSAKMPKVAYQRSGQSLTAMPKGFAGYFVPASQIAGFIPTGLNR